MVFNSSFILDISFFLFFLGTKVGGPRFSSLMAQLPELKELQISRCPNIHQRDLDFLKQHQKLEHLDICNSSFLTIPF